MRAAVKGVKVAAPLLATLAVTLLNPQVYLDTLVMLGVVGALQESPGGFFIGATLASFGWFFGLVAAASLLPVAVAGPIMGAVTDRSDIKRAFRWVSVGLLVCPVLMLGAMAAGVLVMWVIFWPWEIKFYIHF